MKKVLFFIFSCFISLVFSSTVYANSIDSIDMNVYIDENGDAHITEVWSASLTQGTEGYKPYGNLGISEIKDFIVTDDSGQLYKYQSYWSTSAAFDYKAYKNGIVDTGDGYELCWGISTYGDRVYTLKYTITDFIEQYDDSQGIYFGFIHPDFQSVDNVTITISTFYEFNEENSQIWAFGYYPGTINFIDGKIVMDSEGYLSTYSYMVALVKIESETFKTSKIYPGTFEDVYNQAMSGVDYDDDDYDYDNNSNYGNFNSRFFTTFLLIGMLFSYTIPIIILVSIIKIFTNGKDSNEEFEGTNKLPSKKDLNYYREIPCNKDIYYAYWLCKKFNMVNERTYKSGLVGALLLSWIRDNKITIIKGNKKIFSKDDNYSLDLSKLLHTSNAVDCKFIDMLKLASGSNDILEANEFKKWCKRNYTSLNSWFSKVDSYVKDYLKENNLVIDNVVETKTLFGTRKKGTRIYIAKVREEAIKLAELRKFLLDFSVINTREAIEVKLWEEYLIFANILGIADKVEEQFSKLYPEFNDMTNLDTTYTTIVMRDFAWVSVTSAINAYNAAQSSSSSSSGGGGFSSGGGGSSFSGGGGGSSGSSSGGGFR